MLRLRWFVLLALLAFIGVLLLRLPARWISAALPQDVACADASGTLWHGQCAVLTLSGQSLGQLNWQLASWSLLGRRATANTSVVGSALQASASIEVTNGSEWLLRDLRLELRLPTPWVARIPADLAGRLSAQLQWLRLKDGWVRDIRGTIQAQQLVSGGPAPAPLGNFEINFNEPPQAGKLVGKLRDLGGPLAVQGSLTLLPSPGYLLEGTVAARAEANAVLQRQLAMLGAPDAAGRRRFAQEAAL